MNLTVCYFVAVSILVLSVIIALIYNKISKSEKVINKPGFCLFGGVFLSLFSLLLPIFYDKFAGEQYSVVSTALVSAHTTIRTFALDVDFDIIQNNISGLKPLLRALYSITASILFIIAPLLTFGFILSFFKNIASRRRYLFGYFKEAYIFSELNEKSLSLAESILEKKENALIVYTDVFEKKEEQSFERIEHARKIGAICFQHDIHSSFFKRHRGKMSFFIIGENEEENINQSLKLIETYRSAKNVHLYLFSTRVESELLLTNTVKGNIKVRRVNEVRSLIYRTLYESGDELFTSAAPTADGNKLISVVVVGLGRHGTEMLRALTWFCQMDGYRIRIDAFDKEKNAESVFTALCPELMSYRYNEQIIEGEAQYSIKIHSGYEVNTVEFVEEISKLESPTYVFVALGNDTDNIKTAVNLRMIFERLHIKPLIKTVVYSTLEKDALEGVKSFNGESYNIDFIGDIKSSYSERVIIDSDLEEKALICHLKSGGVEEDFWLYEYNYRSSIALAIHIEARIKCRILGAGKPEHELTNEEKVIIGPLEHRRWNAYMRSEGYIYSRSPDKSSRNDLGKMHNNLDSYVELSDDDKKKDYISSLKDYKKITADDSEGNV